MEVTDEVANNIFHQNGLRVESLTGQDSTSGSASTSPTSDTTASATDTDPSEGPCTDSLRVI